NLGRRGPEGDPVSGDSLCLEKGTNSSFYFSLGSTFQFTATNTIDAQQVGNLWHGEHLVTLSLSGDLNYLDGNTGEILRTVRGHQKGITALAVGPDRTLFTGS